MAAQHVVAGCSPQPDGTDRPSPPHSAGRACDHLKGSSGAGKHDCGGRYRDWGISEGKGSRGRASQSSGHPPSPWADRSDGGPGHCSGEAASSLSPWWALLCPRAAAALSRGHPLQGPCRPQTQLTQQRPSTTLQLPPLTRLRTTGLTHLRVNGDEEVFDLWAGTTSHLQEHVPRLPGALPDRGAHHENAVSALSSAPQSPLKVKAGVSQAPCPQQMFHFLY